MEKVTFDGDVVRSAKTGLVVGHIQPSRDQCIDVLLNNGMHQYAYYGTMSDTGEFFSFCRNTSACEKYCHGRGENDLSCRYNRKGTANAGYYVNTTATESVYWYPKKKKGIFLSSKEVLFLFKFYEKIMNF